MEDARLLIWLQLPREDTAASEARRAVNGLRHLVGDATDDVLVAVSEVVSNAVRHSNAAADDRVDFKVLEGGGRVRVEVRDGGTGFSGPSAAALDLERDLDRDSGRGLGMVARMADDWGIDTADGTTVWFELSCGPAVDPWRTELTQALVDSALEALVTVDADGTVLDWNDAAAAMFGLTRNEATGRSVADLIVPTEAAAGSHRLRGDLRTNVDIGQSMEVTLVRSDGSPFPAQVRLSRSAHSARDFFHFSILDLSDQKRSEEASAQMLAYLAYLADASEVLASSLDVDRTLRRLARLVVPTHADWCTVNLLEHDDTIRRVAAEHADPARAAELARLLDAHPNEPDSSSGVAQVIRTGEAQLYAEVTDALLAETANDPEYFEITRQLQIRSCVIAPLEARGRVLGSISFVYTEQDKTYDSADLALAQDLGRRAGLAIDNARLYEQRDNIAMTLQRSLLPPYLPEVPDFDLAAHYAPAGTGNEVGGDFYDVFEVSATEWNLVIGDVEGKGPAAAALIGLARHTLRAVAFDHPSPAEALRILNQVLISNASELCCTVALCRLRVDEDGASATVARAGHPAPLMVRRGGAVEPLGADGTLLGAFAEPRISESVTAVYPGDNLVMFTDGVLGMRTLADNRLRAILSELAGKAPKEIADEVAAAVHQAQPGGLADDVAILVVRDAHVR